MRRAVFTAAVFFWAGAAVAAPAPVEDLAGGSDKVARLERMVKAKQQSDFEMMQRLDSLQREVQDLRGLAEQQSYQINQMLQRQRQLYDEIANLQAQPASTAVTVETNTETAAASLSETASYEQAVNLVLKERKYDAAIPAFKDFIQKFPESSYAANAHYWLGQLLYTKGEFEQASVAFNTVIAKFKTSSKFGDSLVKLGMIAEKSSDITAAKRYYNQVLKDHADSAAARIAKQQLTALK